MRILHVINQLDLRAGAEVSLLELVLGSERDACDHAVVVLRGAPPQSLLQAGIPVFTARAGESGRWRAMRQVRASIRAFDPDLIHTSLFESDLAGRIAGFASRTPVLTSLVNTPYAAEAFAAEVITPWKLRQVRSLDRILARHATTAFHAISEATAQHAVTHLGVSRSYIRVIPRGRRPTELGELTPERRARIREQHGWGNRPVLINVAREEPQKGHHLLVEAMKGVLRETPEALLVLVGRKGRGSPKLDQAIGDRQMEDSVVRLGERSDVPDLLAAADLFVFSSLYEGLGGAVIEAAGLGLPVVSFDVPAVREVLGPEHPWLVPVGDAVALGRAVHEALTSDREELELIGRAQRDRFLERFEMTAVVESMLRLYRDVLEASSTHPRSWPGRVEVSAR